MHVEIPSVSRPTLLAIESWSYQRGSVYVQGLQHSHEYHIDCLPKATGDADERKIDTRLKSDIYQKVKEFAM